MFGMHAKCMVGLSLIHYQGGNQSIVLISFINNKHWPLGEVVLKSIPFAFAMVPRALIEYSQVSIARLVSPGRASRKSPMIFQH